MDCELIFWVSAAIAGMISFGILYFLAKKNAETYVDMEGWE